MEKVFLLSIGEAFLKGRNQFLFIKKIKSSIEIQLLNYYKKSKADIIIKRQGSKFVLFIEKFLNSIKKDISKENLDESLSVLLKVFGIKVIILADMYEVSASIKVIGNIILDYILKEDIEVTSLNIKRIEKNNEFKSPEVHSYVKEKLPKEKALHYKSENKLYVEIANKKFFMYDKKYDSFGGLPVSSGGKVVALLSGGIDSPIAIWQMMRRGCEVIAIHFNHKKSYEKIEEIIDKLNEYSPIPVKLIVIDTEELTKEIIKNFKANDRMIIFRRILFKVADRICESEKAKAIVSGDNLAQVASQTLENLNAVSFGLNNIIIRPLVCYEKEEIISLSKKIGLFDISIKQCADFCSMIVSSSPIIKFDKRKMEKNEEVICGLVDYLIK